MAGTDRLESLKDLLKETARAHHAATGGVNAAWAEWYAAYLESRIEEHVGSRPPAEAIAAWLTDADVLYRSEERNVGWPRFYAGFILDQIESG